MTKSEFYRRLKVATEELMLLTLKHITNTLSGNTSYLIEPNIREHSDHLNQMELDKLDELNALKNKLFTIDEVCELLFMDGRVPKWINTEVYKSTRNKTIIKLTASRRFREDKDLYHEIDPYPPFHLQVPLPPWYKEGEKFDINFKHYRWKWHWKVWWMNRKLE